MKNYSFARAVFLCFRLVKRVLWLEECGGCLKDLSRGVQGRVTCLILKTHLLAPRQLPHSHKTFAVARSVVAAAPTSARRRGF